jgi:hypothetical protein
MNWGLPALVRSEPSEENRVRPGGPDEGVSSPVRIVAESSVARERNAVKAERIAVHDMSSPGITDASIPSLRPRAGVRDGTAGGGFHAS